MTVKEQLHQTIDQLPDDCDFAAELYRLYLESEIALGLEDINEGRVVSDEEARKRLSKWIID